LNNLLCIHKNRPTPEAMPLPIMISHSPIPFSGVIPIAVKNKETTHEATKPTITAINIENKAETTDLFIESIV